MRTTGVVRLREIVTESLFLGALKIFKRIIKVIPKK
jgi:hypothetical protein